MAKPIDFNKVRKRRQRTQTLKRLVILAAIFALIGGIVALNSFLIEQGITTQLSDWIGGMGGSGYPVPVPGGIIRDVKAAGNAMAVLNDTNLAIYTDKGKQSGNFQEMTGNTVLLAGDDRLLTFDVGAKQFAVHSRTKTLLKKDIEYGIFAGGMNQRGDYAIVSSSKQAICQINVYNKQLKEIYICYLTENLVGSVGISPSGKMMAAGWLSGNGGVLLSGVNVYLFSNQEGPVATVELGDDLILDVRFFEDDRIGILTDRQYLVIGADGSEKYSYRYGNRQLTAFEAEGRQMLLLCENRETRMSNVILLDAELKEKAVYETNDKITDIALAPRRVYLLTEKGVATYSQSFEPLGFEEALFATNLQLVKGRVYYLTREEIRVLGQKQEAPPGEEGEGAESSGQAASEPEEPSASGDGEPLLEGDGP